MENNLDSSAIAGALQSHTPEVQLTFVLRCAQRLLPNYIRFTEEAGWGNSRALQQSIDVAWRHVKGEQIDDTTIGQLIENIERATPNTEDFDQGEVSSALDACIVCINALEFIRQPDLKIVTDVAALAIDTADRRSQIAGEIDPNSTSCESEILRHPIMQNELKSQRLDLEELLRPSGFLPP